MRILFFGTPQFALPSLQALVDSHHQIAAVVTQPDRPKGRKLHTVSPPVKIKADREGILCMQPYSLKEKGIEKQIKALSPDIAVVVAFGQIIPNWLLEFPPHGCLNLHASLLPSYRGAAPIQRALMDGVKETGISIMRLDSGIDTGPIYRQEKLEVTDDDTAVSLYIRLSELGARVLMQVIEEIEKGTAVLKPQDENLANYAPKIEKEEGEIKWLLPAEVIHNLIRALNPTPGAYTFFGSRRLKIWKTRKEPTMLQTKGKAGEILAAGRELLVATGTIPLAIVEVQPENKDRITGDEFVRGYRIKKGDKFGE